MMTTNQIPTTPEKEGRVDFGMIFVSIAAMFALIFSFVGFVINDNTDSNTSTAGDPGTQATVPLVLTEFALSPNAINVSAGGSLEVTNEGTQIHNVMVEGTDLISEDLATGQTDIVDISSLDPGEYTIICHISGHKEAGMTGTLTVTEGGGEVAAPVETDGHGGGHGDEKSVEEWTAMDDKMLESVKAFPAATEGIGNVPLEPTILEDGTKQFDLTAEIVEWEVEPGKFVEAWTYNGMVPGPWIKVDVGDNVRVSVKNNLPGGTDVHWHGIKTPNAMDGVAPITQELIRPGEEYVYEFTARNKSLGMYHAHHMGHTQVPNGMLGVFQIGDMELPRGRTISGTPIPADLEIAQEYPMVLNDAGTIGLSLNGKSFPATSPLVVNEGDWVLVHYMNEGLQVHPMHQHQFGQLVVAKDGVPLDNPYWADTVNVAPGERYSVLINADEAGTWVWHCHILTHVEGEDGMFGMVTAMVVT